jgi:uncharacterized membrane protein YvbJ
MAFFKTRKPRQFEYKPRFYDPKKEELEISKERFGNIEGQLYNRRINFRDSMNEKKHQKLKKPIPIAKILLYASLAMIAIYLLLTFIEKW